VPEWQASPKPAHRGAQQAIGDGRRSDENTGRERHHVLERFLSRNGRLRAGRRVFVDVFPYRGYLNLRGDPKDNEFVAAVQEVLGQPLPLAANTITEGAVCVFWLGPDEWLVMTEPGVQTTLESRLREVLAGSTYALTDLTGGLICIRLRGRNARDVLAKGSTVDFHPRVFLPGQCAQTVLGKASMLIARPLPQRENAGRVDASSSDVEGSAQAAAVFDIVVRRTFAEYAAKWLYRSAEEFSG